MRVLFLSKLGECVSIAQRLQGEGHSIEVFIDDVDYKHIAKGLITTTNKIGRLLIGKLPNASLLKSILEYSPDFIVIDSTGYGMVADWLKDKGKAVLGGSLMSDVLETNDKYAPEMLKLNGLTMWDSKTEGIPLTTSMWFDGSRFHLHTLTFEEYTLMNEGIGPVVRGAGVITRRIPQDCRLITKGLGKMKNLFKKSTYRGPIHLECVVTFKA